VPLVSEAYHTAVLLVPTNLDPLATGAPSRCLRAAPLVGTPWVVSTFVVLGTIDQVLRVMVVLFLIGKLVHYVLEGRATAVV